MTTTHSSPELLRASEERTDMERLAKGPNAYRTISEVADELHVPQHVLRFWETRFPEVKPLKRGGGRRYYSPEDIHTLRHITDLLYVQGYTIKGVQRVLKEQSGTVGVPPSPQSEATAVPSRSEETRSVAPQERPSLDIPEFPASQKEAVTEGEAETLSPDQVIAPHSAETSSVPDSYEARTEHDDVPHAEQGLADTGEETTALTGDAVVSEATQNRELEKSDGNESTIAAVLFDELVDLRARRDKWVKERQALRLALEDVLGELDNLRSMMPKAG
ncbi:MerR family transcriptional regulator [Asaia astilbis]